MGTCQEWHQQEKHWTVPQTNGAITYLLALFAGEPVEVEPSLGSVNVPGNRGPSHEPAGPQTVATNVKLLDQVRQAIRTQHYSYSYRTEEAYVGSIRRFLLCHDQRHPSELGAVEVSRFLTALAVDRRAASSTQNQALAAHPVSLQRRALPGPWLAG